MEIRKATSLLINELLVSYRNFLFTLPYSTTIEKQIFDLILVKVLKTVNTDKFLSNYLSHKLLRVFSTNEG